MPRDFPTMVWCRWRRRTLCAKTVTRRQTASTTAALVASWLRSSSLFSSSLLSSFLSTSLSPCSWSTSRYAQLCQSVNSSFSSSVEEFNVATLVHRALSGARSQSHLADDCCLLTDARPRRLHSADTRTLLVSRTQINLCDRTFNAAGPRVWNSLLAGLRQPDLPYSRYRQSLNIHFYVGSSTTAQCEPVQLLFRNPVTYLLTDLHKHRFADGLSGALEAALLF